MRVLKWCNSMRTRHLSSDEARNAKSLLFGQDVAQKGTRDICGFGKKIARSRVDSGAIIGANKTN